MPTHVDPHWIMLLRCWIESLKTFAGDLPAKFIWNFLIRAFILARLFHLLDIFFCNPLDNLLFDIIHLTFFFLTESAYDLVVPYGPWAARNQKRSPLLTYPSTLHSIKYIALHVAESNPSSRRKIIQTCPKKTKKKKKHDPVIRMGSFVEIIEDIKVQILSVGLFLIAVETSFFLSRITPMTSS